MGSFVGLLRVLVVLGVEVALAVAMVVVVVVVVVLLLLLQLLLLKMVHLFVAMTPLSHIPLLTKTLNMSPFVESSAT